MKLLPTASGAVLSADRRYRYVLWRHWGPDDSRVLFIGLNPSTADESSDDPTLRRCMAFARNWGYAGVLIANLFAWRATDPRDLRQAQDPVGADNDGWLQRLAGDASLCVAAWGNHGEWQGRSAKVQRLLPKLQCLAVNKSGQPAHPLYQPASREAQPWMGKG